MHLLTLKPGTMFMCNNPRSNSDEELFEVPQDRNRRDPFYITVEAETDVRYYWTGFHERRNCNVQYSVFKSDAHK